MPRRTNPSNNGVVKTNHPKRKLHHPPQPNAPAPSTAALPIHKQPALLIERRLLTALSLTLEQALADPNLTVKIQQIKALLYAKRFLEVFEREQWLDVYAARWVPSRVLAFREIFAEVELLERRREIADILGRDGADAGGMDGPQRVVCLGGGAGSEFIALAGIVAQRMEVSDEQDTPQESSTDPLEVHLVDIGPYAPLMDRFAESAIPRLVTASDAITGTFHQTDILSPSAEPLLRSLLHRDSSAPPPIVTLLFTLTELFIQSRPATVAFLQKMTTLAPRGTLFLIVDAANEEASAVSVGKEGRSWSLATVMDGVLCAMPTQTTAAAAAEDTPAPGTRSRAAWKKLEAEDSKWFRLREGLQEHYPIKLENARYWLRLYRRN
ncbi:hypothetical protein NliqN6_3658 [Naganishia liquefaciens]|uniref:Uncharacterized protein n=1 Tax=Naganishia liquefaciens TaxID=104408 RepID=A0A8H3TTJ1_9TREE|nr:hypothetical protein NliqN6_3658 [Naganishia liquefaciens]